MKKFAYIYNPTQMKAHTSEEIRDFCQKTYKDSEGHYYNIGNRMFVEALLRQVKNISPLNVDNYSEDALAQADHFLIQEANFINSHYEFSERFLTFIENNQRPTTLVSGGVQFEGYNNIEDIRLTPSVRRFLDIVKERSHSIGVRGNKTAEVLNDLGIKNTHVIGCPSMFYTMNPFLSISKNTCPPSHIVTNFTPRGELIDYVRMFYQWAVEHNTTYIPQDIAPFFHAKEREETPAPLPHYFYHLAPRWNYTFAHKIYDWLKNKAEIFYGGHEMIEFLKENADFVIGGRLHGSIAAIQAQKPVLMVVSDARVREVCEFLNIPFIFLSEFDRNKSPQEYYEQVDYSFFNKTYKSRYDNYRTFLENNGIEHHLPASYEGEPKPVLGENTMNAAVSQYLRDCITTNTRPNMHEYHLRSQRVYFHNNEPQSVIFEKAYSQRIDMMVKYIPSNISSINDFGCSQCYLKTLIGDTITYQGYDKFPQSKDVIYVDFNANEFPQKQADLAFCSGVLEYVKDPQIFIKNLCHNHKTVLLSYSNMSDFQHHLWVNKLNKEDIIELFLQFNFELCGFHEDIIFLFKEKTT